MKDVGGIVKTDINGDPAKLHSECDENGCGEKYDVDGSGRIVELEADEAVIVPEAFEDKCFNDSFCKKPNYYEITGTIKQIASAINVLGGGINFAKGAKVLKNGRKMNVPRLTGQNKTNSISSRIIDSGSVVINRTNMNNPKVMTFKGTLYEIASDINSFGGNGVKLIETNNDNPKKKEGGSIEIDKNKIYKEWSELVNMSKSELEKFYNSEEGKKAGLKPSEAKKQGIDYGRESARWILKMKDTPKTKWSNDMWKWAKKQISFIKRMSGVEGDLYNDKGEKTRKYLALLIWGNDPEKYAKGGSIVGDKQNRPFKVRFHLGRGKNFMHWKIEEKNKPDIFEDPEEVQLIMYNCKLTNQPTTAQKIYSGKINKAPIAYIQCEEVAILPTDVEDIEESNQLRYNPRINPYWTDTDNDNVDNYYFDKIVSKGSKVYFEEITP